MTAEQIDAIRQERDQMRDVLMEFWTRGEDFPWHIYCPSFAVFMREALEWRETGRCIASRVTN